jgi:O-acetyl-ADP-ribose deacetylase
MAAETAHQARLGPQAMSEFAARFASTTVVLKRGDITAEKVDVIVNAANSSLLGGGGVDGAIHRAGGPAILEECRAIRERQGGCPTGEAVITTAGRLASRWVVHTVGPVWRGGREGEPDRLRRAYLNSLKLAADHGARTIAFPAISTGIYGYPVEQAARVAIEAAQEFAKRDSRLSEIRFILFSDRDLELYQDALAQVTVSANQNPSDDHQQASPAA